MGDETMFEFLHAEIVNYVIRRNEIKNKDSKDELDTMKFICTDFWTAIYKKQIDNLRTNHQGVYVLQDNGFRFLTRISEGRQYLDVAPRYVAFTCGVIRGSLANLGINCLVTAEIQNMPLCKFHIQVQRT